ncbi:MAG: 2Fe-2S iron-sulfur cluster-binding protein [Tissierellia bacterium]|nr:2Fe-2S iron-sulfur cluster-binding protein [Tissierellia bacterium]
MSLVNLIIDGKSIKAEEGISILQAATEAGIEIPALCTDPNLEVVASCRLCMVEIEGMQKPETSCTIKVREGMVVKTKTPRVKKMRRQIIQLLLDSHPNDCLTCQKAGECLLQKYAYEYNASFRDHEGKKRKFDKDLTSPYILKDDEKCILCGKCVRACNQIEERRVLSLSNRGYKTKLALDWGKHFDKSTCVSCNRCVAVCPVGALMDRRSYRKARSWETERKTVECKVCEYGCKFDVISKNGVNIALEANRPDQGRPLCLKGRMTTEMLYLDKPDAVYKKEKDSFKETTWAQVTGLEDAIEKVLRLDKE